MNLDLDKVDFSQVLLQRLLKVNMAVATFVFLANSSALLVGLSGKAPEVLSNLFEIVLIITVAAAVLITGVLALSKPAYCTKILYFQVIAITSGTIAMLLWGLSLAVNPTEALSPSSMKVSWSVGWLTALTSYSAYLISQTYLVDAYNRTIVVKYAYIWVGAIAFIVDMFIFLRLAAMTLK
jgi:hypothetical protein